MRAFIVLSLVAFVACVGDSNSNGNDGGPDATNDVTLDVSSDAPDAADACSTTCNGVCVDTSSDPQNCGGCGNTCTKGTVNFACVQSKCGNVVTNVQTSANNSCVVLLEGTVWCWGDEGSGETGQVGTFTPAPTKVAGLKNVTQIAGATSSWCALETDGTVWCWGSNGSGQLAQTIGADPDCNGSCDPTPRQVTLVDKATEIAGGSNTFCAIVAGNVYCWGTASTAILGTTSSTASSAPVKIPSFSGDAVSIGFGLSDNGFPGVHDHACAIRSDTSVWCWGSNNQGELGHAEQAGSPADTGCYSNAWCNPTPEPVKDGSAQTIMGFKSVVTGNQTSCGIKADGTLWCWGSNNEGALGIGSFDTCVFCSHNVPGQVMTNAAFVAFSELTGFVIDTGGTVRSWGANLDGSLGQGTLNTGTQCANSNCAESPTTVTLLANAKQISMHFEHGLALMADGSVFAWGLNDSAQLGHAPGTGTDVTCGTSSHCNPTPAALASTPW